MQVSEFVSEVEPDVSQPSARSKVQKARRVIGWVVGLVLVVGLASWLYVGSNPKLATGSTRWSDNTGYVGSSAPLGFDTSSVLTSRTAHVGTTVRNDGAYEMRVSVPATDYNSPQHPRQYSDIALRNVNFQSWFEYTPKQNRLYSVSVAPGEEFAVDLYFDIEPREGAGMCTVFRMTTVELEVSTLGIPKTVEAPLNEPIDWRGDPAIGLGTEQCAR